jgi:hypothetical protein
VGGVSFNCRRTHRMTDMMPQSANKHANTPAIGGQTIHMNIAVP